MNTKILSNQQEESGLRLCFQSSSKKYSLNIKRVLLVPISKIVKSKHPFKADNSG